jgi:hypothetical protein
VRALLPSTVQWDNATASISAAAAIALVLATLIIMRRRHLI